MVTTTNYDYDDHSVDVGSELEKLRRHYADLQREKQEGKQRAAERAMSARPTPTQLRLYQKGVDRISTQKMEEEIEKNFDPFTVEVRDASPLPICDRLYEEGMVKKLQAWEQEQEQLNEAHARTTAKGRATSSPICDRLYEQGIAKVRKEKEQEMQRSRTRASRNTSPSIRSSSPNATCDRLYNEGLKKIRSTSKSKLGTPRNSRSRPTRNVSPNVTCDRLYAQGKAKLRASTPNLPPRRSSSKKSLRHIPVEDDELFSDDLEARMDNIKIRGSSPCPLSRKSFED